MSFIINPITDLPYEDAKLLGHKQIVSNLKTFLEKDNMITPLSIAIHGEWGSGKTSIMKTLSKQLNSSQFEVMFFEAWKYEYSNPSLGLISELAQKFAKGNAVLISSILRAAFIILSNKYLGADPDKVVKILQRSKHATETLSSQLSATIKQKIGQKKLIIIIDDLDRCDVENTLQLLAIIKLFLDIDNCICIAAVDFNRLKQAWKYKYKITEADDKNGTEYLDKIFQIRIGIPKPPSEQIKDYVDTLIDDLPEKISKLFSETLPKNPRAIKRILNLVAYRQNLLDSHYKEFSAIFWTILEDIISNEKLIFTHDNLLKNGSSLHRLIATIDNWKTIEGVLEKLGAKNIVIYKREKLEMFFKFTYEICTEFSITQDILEKDFQILCSATNEALR